MGRKKTACQACAEIKAKCITSQDFTGQPCDRCNRLALSCSHLLPHHRPSELLADKQQKKGKKSGKTYHSRSTDGCITCRRKHVKCDEKLPACSVCQRLCVPCRKISSAPPPLSSKASICSSSSSPPSSSSTPTLLLDWVALFEDQDHHERTKSSSLAQSVALVNLPMGCHGDDKLGLALLLAPTALNGLAGITPDNIASWTISQRHLLNHFLQSVSRALVVVDNDAANPLLRVMVPLALENLAVKHALLALSACHLSQVYLEWEKDVLDYRSCALQDLKEEMADMGTGNSTVSALASTLLQCLLEVRI